MHDFSLDLSALRKLLASDLTPTLLAERLWPSLEASQKKHVWIELFTRDALLAAARALEARKAAGEALPLYGIPFAVKDNIDLAGSATTAAWPALSARVERSAPVVERMLRAGALCVGKTNLDQLATGLVGVRSPYGVPENPFDAKRIPGGSSSGSAVAVASGLVSFALGTDTAGSGRVPAGLNNVVGLKPTRGLFSRRGVLPACRSLDGISIFALTVADAAEIAGLCAGYDADDPYSRADAASVPFGVAALPKSFRFGVPDDAALAALGGGARRAAWSAALERLTRLGGVATPLDFTPFARTAELLYEGAWIAERHASLRDIVQGRSGELLPVIASLLARAERFSASDAFACEHELARLKRRADTELAKVDVLVVPTAPIFPTLAEVEAEPLALNQQLGALMNFGNLLDLSALAVPSGLADGLPFGVTLYGPRDADARLAALGQAVQRDAGGKLGATPHAVPSEAASTPFAAGAGGMLLAVVGAHLSGQPLNHQLTSLGATLARACKTADKYKLYALKGTVPPKPGLERVAQGGGAIEVEVWRLTTEAFGRFMQGVPAPLVIGTLELEDGQSVHGFLCEPFALRDATDISEHGGWRAYLATKSR